jgi:hypothetical protein
MQEITNEAFTAAVEAEVCEVFELMTGQSSYLEVLQGEEKLVGVLVTFETGEFHNCSYLFESKGDKYAINVAVDEGKAKQTFFEYADVAEARQQALELLTAVTS